MCPSCYFFNIVSFYYILIIWNSQAIEAKMTNSVKAESHFPVMQNYSFVVLRKQNRNAHCLESHKCCNPLSLPSRD